MSPFIIFFILYTLATGLYYLVVINIDIKAYDRKVEKTVETISANSEEDDFTHTPKSVVEDPETGGFMFADAMTPPAVLPEEEGNYFTMQEEQTPDTGTETQPSQPDVMPEEQSIEEANTPSTQQEETEDEDDFGLTVIRYNEEEPVKEDDTPIDVSQAFDRSLKQPKFGVAAVIGEPGSPETKQKANDVNANMEDIPRRGNQFTLGEFNKALRNRELVTKYNIYTKDEYNKC